MTILNFSNNIYLLPVTVIGVSFALAAFPTFSKLYAESDFTELGKKFSSTFRQVAFIVIPVSFLIWLLRDSIIGLIYFHGQFTAAAALLMSASLAILSAAIFFYSEIQVLYRMFFALKDTITPTVITILHVAVSIFLSFTFVDLAGKEPLHGWLRDVFNLNQVQDFRILGISLAFSLVLIFQFFLAGFLLARKGDRLILVGEIGFSTIKSFLAALVMAIVIIAARDKIFNGIASPFWDLAVYGVAGAVIYFLAAYALRCREIGNIKEIGLNFLKRFRQE